MKGRTSDVDKILAEACPSLNDIFRVMERHDCSDRDWVSQCMEKNRIRITAPSNFTQITVGVDANSIDVDSLMESCWDANEQLFFPPKEKERRAEIKEEIERKMPKEAQEELRRLEQATQQDEEYKNKRALADRMVNLQRVLLAKIRDVLLKTKDEIPQQYVNDLRLDSITWQTVPVQARELAERYAIVRK